MDNKCHISNACIMMNGLQEGTNYTFTVNQTRFSGGRIPFTRECMQKPSQLLCKSACPHAQFPKESHSRYTIRKDLYIW